ncbi:hypothetical protein DMI62_19150 [Escherichia coli]|nr:hypothetical protein [Escherichia coli]
MVRDKNPIRNRIYGCTYPFYYITEESIAFRERPYMLPRARPDKAVRDKPRAPRKAAILFARSLAGRVAAAPVPCALPCAMVII